MIHRFFIIAKYWILSFFKKDLTPRKYSLCKVTFGNLSEEYKKQYPYPFKEGQVFIFFGEITNMRGHCIVADHKTGKIYSGYHTENFIELTKEEL